ncbi:MAG TPA: ABC transporter permease, partial [Anaerolineae bacterium]|nr:ABC transporter permease [Anaerolineae bacterium]
MDWSLILNWVFVTALVTAAIRLAVPILLATLGEIITERAGVLNLGLDGVMVMGGVTGFMAAYYLQSGPLADVSIWLGLGAGMIAGMLMGLILAVLSVTLRADQVIVSVTLVVFGQGIANYLYRQAFSSLTARTNGLPPLPIPSLSQLPVLGPMLFNHDATVYLTAFLVLVVWFLLFRTTWGLRIRTMGENPAAGETSGWSVNRTRYAAILLGAALAGLGGAVLTVVQLRMFREGIMGGRGWIAVALVIFARWRPSRALLGALLFGLADSIQYRIQALSQIGRGTGTIPYEFLLMLPYVLTLAVLWFRTGRGAAPEVLGRPY